MRPKKNRNSRLLAVNEYFAVFDGEKCDLSKSFAFDSESLFLELGCGKGDFAAALSKRHPETRMIAVEKVVDVIMMAMEKAKGQQCENLRFIHADIEKIHEIMPKNAVTALFINFCDPWPRKKNAKRRLTSPLFLEKYKTLLKKDARLYFKTDNLALFEYSLETLQNAGFTLQNVCFDLHGDEILNKNNIQTEYERTFSQKGFKINTLEAFLPNL